MSVLYVAEIGSQHKGSISLAVEYCRVFKESGASILKMQFGHPGVGGLGIDPIRHVSKEMAETVARYCNHIGLELMASIFSLDGLELARHVNMERYKIAHQTVGDAALVTAILVEGKETFVSFGGGQTLEGSSGATRRFIYTTDKYPTYPWDLRLPESFGDKWSDNMPSDYFGFSDHTHGIAACLLAVARGAQYIEKHVALDKTDLWTKDTSFSATPTEFEELVRLGRGLELVR